jgi:predicted lysophospholipase L1 biosynthesis ABC-type transport system permease subunit
MTAAFKITVRKVSLALALVASFSALSSRASSAFSAEAQQMCTGDAFRLCSSEIPDIPKITACMIKQRASLSSGCRAVLDRDLAAQSRKVAAQ